MRKIIKKYGSSKVIILAPEDMKVYRLKVGDVVEFEIKKVKKRNR